MRNSKKDELLKQILADQELDRFSQTSLENGLTFLRRQRRFRYLVRVAIPLLVVCLGAFTIYFNARFHRASPNLVKIEPPTKTPNASGSVGAIRIINDNELLALFPNRPVALIGTRGQQRLVFLDQSEPQAVQQ